MTTRIIPRTSIGKAFFVLLQMLKRLSGVKFRVDTTPREKTKEPTPTSIYSDQLVSYD